MRIFLLLIGAFLLLGFLVAFFSGRILRIPSVATYVVELETPGGPLPFEMRISRHAPEDFLVRIYNGDAAFLSTRDGDLEFERIGNEDVFRFEQFDSVLRLRGQPDGSLKGSWIKQRPSGQAEMSVAAFHRRNDRFVPVPEAGPPADFSGRWAVDFAASDDFSVGVFSVDADQTATGTFLTPTGDYRYLAGRVDGDLLRLSKFDGAHAFLFHARMRDDGTIEGDFWSGDWHHDTWTAVRDERAALPDAFAQTSATGVGVKELAFRDLEGRPTRVADLLDAGGAPARVLYLFGSWCPNCADAGAEMRRLRDKYGERLAVVGLAFEQTGDFERSARQVRLYAGRHGADWPVLIAGLADKAKASAELPVLDRVRAYPTTVFLDADNAIVAVHTGFSGPATGDEHRRLQRRFEGIVEGLIGP